MKYNYTSKTRSELEAIAEGLLARFPLCRANGKIDIELLVEKLEFTIIPRVGLNTKTCMDALLPPEPGIIIVDADLASGDLLNYRMTLAEEISHKLLEPKLWESGIPLGANLYELDPQIYDDVEGDAYRLALCILMPAEDVETQFATFKKTCVAAGFKNPDQTTIELLAKIYKVTFDACASRCHILELSKSQIRKKPLPGAVIL